MTRVAVSIGVTIGTDWAEMRIAENAWFRFATEAKRKEFRFRVHGGHTQTSFRSTGALSRVF